MWLAKKLKTWKHPGSQWNNFWVEVLLLHNWAESIVTTGQPHCALLEWHLYVVALLQLGEDELDHVVDIMNMGYGWVLPGIR